MLAEAETVTRHARVNATGAALERLAQDRMRMTSFSDTVGDHMERVRAIRRVPFEFAVPEGETRLLRHVERFPYVPSDPRVRDERCFEVYNIQVHGLMKRLTST